MAEKTLMTKLKLRYDSHEKWLSADPVLLAGEVALSTVATKQEGTVNYVPSVLIKVGDGTHKYSELDFAYAKAADVVAAAKTEAALTEFINGVIANSGLATDGAMTALTKRVDDAEDAIETLNGDATTEGSVAKAIADAIADLDLANTYAAKEHDHAIADVTDLQDALDAKVAKEDGKSLIADTEIARLAAMSDGANKVEASETNGNIKIDGVETVVYTHPAKHNITDIEGLQDALDGKQGTGDYAAAEHTHTKDEITDFAHTHIASEITDLDATIKAYDYATKSDAQGYVDAYKDTNDQALADEVQARKDADAELQAAIDAINNADTGILAQAKEYADGKDEAIEAAQKAGDDAMAEAQKKVASVTAGDASVTVGGTTTAPTVAAKLSADADNALTLAEDGLKVVIPAAAEYSVVKDATAADGYAATYHLTKDGTNVGAAINIPKDMVVESGSVVELADGEVEGQTAGTYIKLVLANATEDELYIPVGSLIEYVTSGSAAGDMVVVTVSDDHKVTAIITDGTVTLAKLETSVQTAIGKAHSHENATVLDGITADKVTAWDAAEQNAKDYADGLNGAMDTRVKALEAIDHDAYIAADETVLASAKDYTDEKNTAMNTRVEALESKVDTGDQKVSEYVAAAIEALNIGDYAKAADLTAAIEQHNADKAALEEAIALKANDADLAAIAKTGNVNDLVQTDGDVIILDCGGAE